MRTFKTLLTMIAMLLCSITASAYGFTENGIFYRITSSTDLTVSAEKDVNGNYNTVISIPATVTHNGKTYSVTSIRDYAFEFCSKLTDITIPKSVTSIGDYAFRNCSSLTEIIIPEGVTSIGEEAFSDCSSLTNITIPEGVTSIGKWVFSGTAWLNKQPDDVVYLGNWLIRYKGTKGEIIEVKEGTKGIAGAAFYKHKGITKITIPEGVTSIGDYAFYECSKLTNISIPEGVTSIGDYAFEGCSRLRTINIPESVTSIGDNAFDGTAWLNHQPDGVVYLGNWLITYKGTMPECSSIEIKEGTKGIIGYAFSDCSNLTNITIPESVTSIGNSSFKGCSSLTNITIPESVTSIGSSAFSRCI